MRQLCTVCKLNPLQGQQKFYCSKTCERKGWKDRNRDKILAGKRRYRERNKDKIAIYNRMYKAKVPHISAQLATRLKATYPCLRCGMKESLEVHHIKHQTLGGGVNDLNNLVVLCKHCHARWHRMFDTRYWVWGRSESMPAELDDAA
jgi:5-methylcytosine-specific restriction endonuclease McrA